MASSQEADLEAFWGWLTKNGVKTADTGVRAGPSTLLGGRGLVATRPITKGSTFAAVPQGLSVSASGARKSADLWRYISGFEGWTGDTGVMALQILWERSKGEKSRLAPWMAVLPAQGELDLPLFWGKEDLDLADASSTRGISGLAEDVTEDYAWLQQNVFGPNPGVFMPAEAFSVDAFRWAVGVVMSRSFFVDGELRLTPLVDFANHSPEASAQEPTGGGMALLGGRAVKLAAGRDYEEGEEVFISYGPRGGAAYLEEHGFVPEMAKADAGCELEFSLDKGDRFLDDKEDILEINGLQPTVTFDLAAVGAPDPELIHFLRLSLLGSEDAFLLEGIFRNEVWSFMELPVSPVNEEAVDRYLRERCASELSSLAGSEEEDDVLAGPSPPPEASGPACLCARVRKGERLALKRTAEWCRSDLEGLQQKEYYQERRLKELNLDVPLSEDEVYDGATSRVPGGGPGRDLDW